MFNIYVFLGLFLLLLGMIGIAGWFASERLLRVTKTWYLVNLRVSNATNETVTLPRRKETTYDGIYGITWEQHTAILGEIVESSEQTVTRRIIKTTHPLSTGLQVAWNIFVYTDNPKNALGLTYEEVHIPGELGSSPAWFVPGTRATWVLLIHGFHASREETLRVLPPLSQMGFPMLALTYRNDAGAPLSSDHFYHLGDTEWRDLEAGVRYARAQGAQDVVLYGWSMGGCIVETFLHRTTEATHVRAVVLDAPILDWHGALDAQLHSLHFPHWFTYVMKWIVAQRAGINFNELNYVRLAGETTTPTLLFHGVVDSMVPVTASDLFAQGRPDLVTYQRVEHADHTQAWNVNQQTYEDVLKTFLTRIAPEKQAKATT